MASGELEALSYGPVGSAGSSDYGGALIAPTRGVDGGDEDMARLAALAEDEAAQQLEARCSVAHALLSSINERHEALESGRLALERTAAERYDLAEYSARRCQMLSEAASACKQRLALLRELLVAGGRKIEALRVRGAIAEELLRGKTIATGERACTHDTLCVERRAIST